VRLGQATRAPDPSRPRTHETVCATDGLRGARALLLATNRLASNTMHTPAARGRSSTATTPNTGGVERSSEQGCSTRPQRPAGGRRRRPGWGREGGERDRCERVEARREDALV
jgi:hypothetical protein